MHPQFVALAGGVDGLVEDVPSHLSIAVEYGVSGFALVYSNEGIRDSGSIE